MDISIIHIVPNGILMTCMLVGLFFTNQAILFLSNDLQFIVLFIFIYLGLSTLGAAYMRFLYVIMPWILYWLAFVFEEKIEVKGFT